MAETARLVAMRNSGGGNEEEEQGNGRKSAGQIAYEKKQQHKRIVAESQALMNHRKAQEQTQNAIAKNKNLTAAEAEMDKVKPVTPYVAASYIDKDEEMRLKGQESQRAWAAVNAREAEKQGLPASVKTITVSGGLFGPPVPNISPEDIEDEPPGKEIPPRIQTLVEATGIAVDLFAYITYYEVPKIRNDYSGSVNISPFSKWNPTPAPIPYKNPDASELWWVINSVQIENSSYENIYVRRIDLSISSNDFNSRINVYPPFTPMHSAGDFNLVEPNFASKLFEINDDNLIPPGGEVILKILVFSETGRFGSLAINIKP